MEMSGFINITPVNFAPTKDMVGWLLGYFITTPLELYSRYYVP